MANKQKQRCVRLDAETSEKLNLLIELKKASLADVVRNAIHSYYADLESELEVFLLDKEILRMFASGSSISCIILELKVSEFTVNKAIRSNLKNGN
jgi:predicted DNA-binding protein